MTEILAVFHSRTQAIDCNNKLNKASIKSTVINTPSEANIGCGLSVKFNINDYARARSIIAHLNYSAFYGYLKIDTSVNKIRLFKNTVK